MREYVESTQCKAWPGINNQRMSAAFAAVVYVLALTEASSNNDEFILGTFYQQRNDRANNLCFSKTSF